MSKLWLIALMIPFSTLHAQVASPDGYTTRQAAGRNNANKHAPESFMSGQIKHLGDFIERFNNASKTKNEAALRALFNEDDPRLPGLAREHHPYATQVSAFVQSANAGKIMIPKRGIMHGAVGIKVLCNGVPDTLKLQLRKDYTADSAAFWHIVKVTAPTRLLEEKVNAEKEQPTAKQVMLPPNAHEVSFLPLLRGMDDYQSLAPFTQCAECRDSDWQKVENALQSGRLMVEAVVLNRISLTAGNWQIELSEFIREKENSGWLISDLVEK